MSITKLTVPDVTTEQTSIASNEDNQRVAAAWPRQLLSAIYLLGVVPRLKVGRDLAPSQFVDSWIVGKRGGTSIETVRVE